MSVGHRWVWADLENTPHVLFLEPIIRRLLAGGLDVRVSAKPQAQTLGLARLRGIAATPVGGGDFRGLAQKLAGGVGRALHLARWARAAGRPALLVSSSRSAALSAWLLRVPSVALLDYEHVHQATIALSDVIWFPDVLRDAALPPKSRRLARFYAGLKENLYLDDWPVDRAAERSALDIAEDEYLVVARPAADSAHYAHADSSRYWLAAVRLLAAREGVRLIVVARNDAQRAELRAQLSDLPRVSLLEKVVNGPGLVAAADLVLGGGGTMNREAAVLGVPAWSTFCGPMPHIDAVLHREGRLRWIRSEAELADARRAPLPARPAPRGPFREGLAAIAADVEARVAAAVRG